jgi:ubiquinone/menaquinone biosynthesis C-methylase UbiE
MNREEMLNSFYTDVCDEDIRLKDRVGNIEFITTIKHIDEIVKIGDRILEIGAGTGRYSLYYASKGYSVDAIEFVPYNLEILKGKITDKMNICAEQGDALNLSRYEDSQFDVTLILGPMYHMFTMEDKKKVLEEAVRVTKKDGYIFIAYVLNEAVVLQYLFAQNHIKEYQDKITESFKCKSYVEEIFDLVRIEEIDEINASQCVMREKLIATDGAATYMREALAKLPEDEYEMFIDYHLKTCDRMDLIGASNHVLDILRVM